MDYNSLNHLNQIKKYIIEKGENINLDDISKINGELIKMIEIIEKKEKLKQTLENYNLKIEQNKQLLNELNELEDDDQNENKENLVNKLNVNNENQLNYNNLNNNINNTSKLSSTKRKSSNRINAVINKYLEIKQDADEFLEKLNKKKIDSQNKYNKYNILIKKKNLITTRVNDLNNNINNINNHKTINSTQKKINNKNNNKSTKIEEYNQLMPNYGQQNNYQEFDLNQDINFEYQKMNSQIEELEKLNLDFNSLNHLNQIKRYINEKGENINLDDISKKKSE